ncbi:hypothetical protein F7734_37865 [Scytonema sp. UIC 10036]|uniref:hypothetical protein n=1 Tax=Scytonema sp. UIC 10036 TaxID=2304196 RepID=UPI0012DAEE54|nr:hypothetical protein [Scytonema sp. UIC 10036]MUG97770.1 hypothetical protein [Scytonema sp. UIC 10036]
MTKLGTKTSIDEQSGKYYFACGFLWWVFHAFYRLLESIETDDIQDRLNECELEFEEVGRWLLDESGKAGLAFRIENKNVSIFAYIEQYEKTIMNWIRDLDSASRNLNQGIASQHYYFYYLECEWLVYMLSVFDRFVKTLNVPELLQSYLDASLHFKDLSDWLQEELSSVAINFLNQEELETYKSEREKLYEKIANSWRLTVISATCNSLAHSVNLHTDTIPFPSNL